MKRFQKYKIIGVEFISPKYYLDLEDEMVKKLPLKLPLTTKHLNHLLKGKGILFEFLSNEEKKEILLASKLFTGLKYRSEEKKILAEKFILTKKSANVNESSCSIYPSHTPEELEIIYNSLQFDFEAEIGIRINYDEVEEIIEEAELKEVQIKRKLNAE